jgi:DNA-directed RNA polymerase subunit N (RpoN/RPB10)
MNKYQYTDKCAEISGFGGGYEDACRKMVIAGMEWMDEHPNANMNIATFNGIPELTLPRTDDAQELENVMNDAVEGCCSVHMIQLSIGCLLCARRLGWDTYIRRLEELGEEKRKEREQQQS